MKRQLCGLLAGVLAAGMLAGCERQAALTVGVTEEMMQQVRPSVERAARELGIEVELAELPGRAEDSGDEGELDRLRTQLMAGEGPDLLLLGWGQQIFPDLEKSARGGAFYDLAPLLDSRLGEMELVEPVLEAGVFGGGRYLVPLGFWMNGVEASEETLAAVSEADGPAEFLASLAGLSSPETMVPYFDMQYTWAQPLIDHAAGKLQLEQLREIYELCARWQKEGLAIASLEAGAAFQPVVLSSGYEPQMRPSVRKSAIPNGAGGATACPALLAAVRANSRYAKPCAEIILRLLPGADPLDGTDSRQKFGNTMLPVERGALEQVAGGVPGLLQAAERVNAAVVPGEEERTVFLRMMAAAMEGKDFDQTAAAIEEEYRYYFHE